MLTRTRIVKIEELLNDTSITIPHYQRPYTWSHKHIHQLIDDILFFCNKHAYRIGNIILHENGVFNDIVDGQQRVITFALIGKALTRNGKNSTPPKIDFRFTDKTSIHNIANNYIEIEKRINEFDDEATTFFLKRCEVAEIVVDDISEAFQLFDCQNARGKDLEPHDLLKAFHLREMSAADEDEKKKAITAWEETPQHELSTIFGKYLFRTRSWSKGYPATTFTKDNIDIFKGFNPDGKDTMPFAGISRIAHCVIDSVNHPLGTITNPYHTRTTNNIHKNFPFQIDGLILNGRRFFEMVAYYKETIDKISSNNTKKTLEHLGIRPDSMAGRILTTINSYPAMHRTGDMHVRNMFDCALLFYVDRFGSIHIEKAIEKIFIWAYKPRLTNFSVHLSTIDKYATEPSSMFKLIRESTNPKDIINLRLDGITEVKSTKTEEINKLFISMGYYNE